MNRFQLLKYIKCKYICIKKGTKNLKKVTKNFKVSPVNTHTQSWMYFQKYFVTWFNQGIYQKLLNLSKGKLWQISNYLSVLLKIKIKVMNKKFKLLIGLEKISLF